MKQQVLLGTLTAACLFVAHLGNLSAASCNVSTNTTNTTLSPPFMGRDKLMVGLSGGDAAAASAPSRRPRTRTSGASASTATSRTSARTSSPAP